MADNYLESQMEIINSMQSALLPQIERGQIEQLRQIGQLQDMLLNTMQD